MIRAALAAILVATLAPAWAAPQTVTYPLEVLPREDRTMTDPLTGAKLLFLSTNAARDNVLYFHQRSFLADDSMALFTSHRKRGGVMGYLFTTGELVRIATPKGKLKDVTAAKTGDRVFGWRGNDVVELSLKIAPSRDPAAERSRVTCTERAIATVGGGMKLHGHISENSNETLLAIGAELPDGMNGIVTVGIATGRVRLVCRIKPSEDHGHVQFSHTSPNLLSYAGEPRVEIVDTNTGEVRAAYRERPGELVTHESWWVGDQIVFCGGFRPGESDVKVLNIHTGVVRIVGAGAWWPDGTPSQLAKWNWWHACADDAGRWVAADNWHGDIVVFDARTCRMVSVTLGHRKYGGLGLGEGDHPHVSWDRSERRVIFTSCLLGTPHVCVATLPEP